MEIQEEAGEYTRIRFKGEGCWIDTRRRTERI